MTCATILRAMSSVVGRKGRINTRERSGTRVGPMRFAWTVGDLRLVIIFSAVRLASDGHFPAGSLKLVRVFCSACISASDSRKASVDSAPWF